MQRARATRPFLAAGVGVGVATALLAVAQAWLLAHVIVGIFHERRVDPFVGSIVALAAVFVGRALLAWANQLVAHRAAASVKSQLRRDVLRARLRRPTGDQASSATLVHVVTDGLDALDGYYAKYLPQLALALVVPLIVGAAILWADWQSALIVAFTLPLIPVFMALIGWTTQQAVARRFRVADRLANHFADLIEGLPTLQAFGRARAQARGVELTEDANRRETMRTLYVSFLSAFALELLANLSVAVVAVTVGFRLVFGHVGFETALFVLILAPEAFLPVRQVGVHFHDSADGVAAADEAFAIIDAGGEAGGSAPAPDLATAAVLVEGATYSHPGSSRTALAPVSFRVDPGAVVALRAPSGGGKTTLLRLLLGFERPTSGSVSVSMGTGESGAESERREIVDLDRDQWLAQVAFVAQHPGMVSGSIADNVRLGAPEISGDQVIEVLTAVAAEVDPFRSVGDDGEGLSAGERRRVALARALARVRFGHARLLVLDEPTAGLDADTEARVVATVAEAGASVVLVSHRPAVMALADTVVDLGGER
ncbi:thiol reductant ABC exporter subunit CydD [Aestuariimicrobium soli]|uniref:thiol reductant ABC exporter subunit CydD n=1 Tax=Aestuariimicrobium soli TaxID=2035834 RepID=UPI003EC087B7